jgi:hypothetical protein
MLWLLTELIVLELVKNQVFWRVNGHTPKWRPQLYQAAASKGRAAQIVSRA